MQNNHSSLLLFLRDVVEADLPVFFDFQLDPGANNMAAFTARDPFGFQIIGQSKGFANARGEEIEELLLELPARETSEEQ